MMVSEEMGREKINFVSWCKSGLYDPDFGWGRPVWVGTPPPELKNFVLLIDTRSGDG
ncbi:hypothetical protein Scep_013386 [Stephania cephalantha]|uniref:Uncharacterized protein n=1 Tax=Stephania cephalantha TaxID=152367 RepID=A0AAP0JGZ9_9MAGN